MKNLIWTLNIALFVGLIALFCTKSTDACYVEYTPSQYNAKMEFKSLNNIGNERLIEHESIYKSIVDENVFSKNRKWNENKNNDGNGGEIIIRREITKTSPPEYRDIKYITHFPNENPPVAFFEINCTKDHDTKQIIGVKEMDPIQSWTVKSITEKEIIISTKDWLCIFPNRYNAGGLIKKAEDSK